MKERKMPADKRPSEYGGGPGMIQRPESVKTASGKNASGHVELTAGEKAMIMRSEGRRGAGMDVTLPVSPVPDANRPAVDEYLKDRKTRLNGYTDADI